MLVCAIAIAVVMYNFWVGQGFFLGMTAPVPDASGKVSLSATSTANFFSSALEIVAWVVSTLASLFIAGVLGLFKAIAAEIAPFFLGAMPNASPVQPPAESGKKPRMPKKQFDDLSRMIIKAAVDGNRELYLMLGNELNSALNDDDAAPELPTAAERSKGGK